MAQPIKKGQTIKKRTTISSIKNKLGLGQEVHKDLSTSRCLAISLPLTPGCLMTNRKISKALSPKGKSFLFLNKRMFLTILVIILISSIVSPKILSYMLVDLSTNIQKKEHQKGVQIILRKLRIK